MTEENQAELTEDMEVVGPGQMLKEGRLTLKLTQQQVAEKLNFTCALIASIENEEFDNRLPSTYTRGYLKNYAKLVNVSCEEVLASYELLGVAAVQQAEMQSFSQITKKQAENSRLMWFSYFILAVLVGLTVVWWQQEHQQEHQQEQAATELANATSTKSQSTKEKNTLAVVNKSDVQKVADTKAQVSSSKTVDIKKLTEKSTTSIQDTNKNTLAKNPQQPTDAVIQKEQGDNKTQPSTSLISSVTFTFSGDCWVNIYDSTGERIAWGIKKADYVMKIKGQAPFAVTLGKPELVSINFNGKDVDMSQFGAGNIAKFSLPLKPKP